MKNGLCNLNIDNNIQYKKLNKYKCLSNFKVNQCQYWDMYQHW